MQHEIRIYSVYNGILFRILLYTMNKMKKRKKHGRSLSPFTPFWLTLGLDCTTTKPSIGILSTATSPTTGLLFEQVSGASFFSRDPPPYYNKTLALPEEQGRYS
jgi:hypothetical protein